MTGADSGPYRINIAHVIFIFRTAGCNKLYIPFFVMINKNMYIFMNKIPAYMVVISFIFRLSSFYCNIVAAFTAAFGTWGFK